MSMIVNAEMSSRTLRMMRSALSDTFMIPVNDIGRVFYHGLILSCIIMGFWLLDSLKDPILTHTIGIEYQPIAKLFSVVTTLIVVCLYDHLTSMVSKLNLFHIISWSFGVVVLVLSALLSDPIIGFKNTLRSPHRLIGWLSYFVIEAYGSLMVALFWSFTNSVMDLEEAKGAYGLIIAIAQVGAIIGSTLATRASYIGIPQLFLVGSMSILSVSLFMKSYYIIFKNKSYSTARARVRSMSESSWSDSGETRDPTSSFDSEAIMEEMLSLEELQSLNDDYSDNNSHRSSGHRGFQRKPDTFTSISVSHTSRFGDNSLSGFLSGFYEGLVLIVRYPYTLKLFGISCLYEVIVTVLDYEFKVVGASSVSLNDGGHSVDEDKFANLLGHFGQLTNLSSFFISIIGFSYLVHHLGVKFTLLIFPAFLFVAVIVVNLVPSLSVLFVVVSIMKALVFSLHDPTKELLYSPTSEPIKFKAKAWIDVFGSRLAKAFGSLLTNFSYGNPILLRNISEVPCLLLALTLLWIAWSIGDDFNKLVANKEKIGDEHL